MIEEWKVVAIRYRNGHAVESHEELLYTGADPGLDVADLLDEFDQAGYATWAYYRNDEGEWVGV